ncbi:Multidrug resistance protein [Ciborinia camelliae]|nr:Multidrug resistance protein [Ciborinia camelliae]
MEEEVQDGRQETPSTADVSLNISRDISLQQLGLTQSDNIMSPAKYSSTNRSDEEGSWSDELIGDFNYRNWLLKKYQHPERCRRTKIGVSFQNLDVYGFNTPTDYQKTVSNYVFVVYNRVLQLFGHKQEMRFNILRDFEGIVRSGEMLMVLGKPGSGCTTLLKTLAGKTHGGFSITFELPRTVMHSEFRGECNYRAESDVHFPHLTVSQTLAVPAQARTPANSLPKSSGRKTSAQRTVIATTAALGLTNTLDSKIGNDFIQGISGGERQRTSIAEVIVCGTSLQSWDNSTRGLDSSNALNFVKVLQTAAQVTGSTHLVTMYQAAQDVYNLFDKVVLLYEGRQIYFGRTDSAKAYFTNLGFVCPKQSTTCDFLVSLTNPAERIQLIRPGFERKVPHTPDDFALAWKRSPERVIVLDDIMIYNQEFPVDQEHLKKLRADQKLYKDAGQRKQSPYLISFSSQVYLCLTRCIQRLVNDIAPPLSSIGGNATISIILGSMFYNLPENTSSFYGRGILIFFTVLTNTFLGAFEGVVLWDQRPIVEKHFQYALYHPAAEAIASMICDLPNKILLTISFNVPFYFLANLRRTPAAFFTFFVFAFCSLLTGSMLFRTIGAMSKTLTGSIAPGACFLLLLMTYTGFVLPISSMHPWFRWFNYIDPVYYTFESLMINEFSGRQFSCAHFVPEGPEYAQTNYNGRQCITVGAAPGATVVDGDAYLASAFQMYPTVLWRNLGIILAFGVFLCGLYLLATEYISAARSKGEVLIFRRGQLPSQSSPGDEEDLTSHEKRMPPNTLKSQQHTSTIVTDSTNNDNRHAATFIWDELSYDLHINGAPKKILDNIEGWIKPGTLTALMGASGAGKTSLLNVLASRTTVGVIRGERLVDAKYQDDGFARKVGYAQQQDVHLSTSTVREALIFSARLRRSNIYSDKEKLAWVDDLIDTLDMSSFVEAVIGVPGEGLNVEQRKRVTIGVELAAKPELLLFLDEPTSGLDSNTAWSICTLLKKLANKGQAILCTIHQPSGTLFEMFDRLIFLHEGKSAYFGELGNNSRTLINYFQRHGSRQCGIHENPAEWLLEVADSSAVSWPDIWSTSEERKAIKRDLVKMKHDLSHSADITDESSSNEFATSFLYQLLTVTKRNFELDWRTPAYLYSKMFLTLGAGLINGFSFYNSQTSIQGVQNQIFSTFLLLTLHGNLVQLTMPHFMDSRTLYETRERSSRTYSWVVFVLSNIISELPEF